MEMTFDPEGLFLSTVFVGFIVSQTPGFQPQVVMFTFSLLLHYFLQLRYTCVKKIATNGPHVIIWLVKYVGI